MDLNTLRNMHPSKVRELIRQEQITSPTAGMSKGYTQANMAIMPKDIAYDFLLFTLRNPKSCPVLDVTEPGSSIPLLVAPKADLRYDLPRYRVYKKGVLSDEVLNLEKYWSDDLVAFLIGCSFTFESPLLDANIPIRHIEEGCNVPMYITNIECVPAGIFHGPTVVSMRPMTEKQAIRAIQITSRFPAVHGAPIHIGNPAAIGIKDINKPEFGDSVTIKPGEIPVFWACGVTPQAVAMAVKPEIFITHAPGHMFICDIKDEGLSVI